MFVERILYLCYSMNNSISPVKFDRNFRIYKSAARFWSVEELLWSAMERGATISSTLQRFKKELRIPVRGAATIASGQ